MRCRCRIGFRHVATRAVACQVVSESGYLTFTVAVPLRPSERRAAKEWLNESRCELEPLVPASGAFDSAGRQHVLRLCIPATSPAPLRQPD